MKKLLIVCVALGSMVMLTGCSFEKIKGMLDGTASKVIEKDQEHQQGFVMTSDEVYTAFDEEVNHIDLSSRGLSGIPDFCNLLAPTDYVKVWSISLANNNIKIADRDLSCLSYLKVLNLSYNDIAYVKTLGSLPSLQELYLHKNEIETTEGFPDFPGLQTLNLGYNKLKEVEGLGHLTSLINLDLPHNQIESIVGLDNMQELKQLRVEYNKLKDIDFAEELKELDLFSAKGNQIKDAIIDDLDRMNEEFMDKYFPSDDEAEENKVVE